MKAKYKCPALLLVVCQDKATADWATGPFRLGAGGWTALSVRPMVLGPGNTPKIIDKEEAAQNLALATFSAMAHGRDPAVDDILDALARALGTADEEDVVFYAEMLESGLGDTRAAKTWRKLVKIHTYFPGRGTLIEETLEQGRVEGQAKERAETVLRMLERREVAVPDEVRERVLGCSDLETLGRWLDRAFTVTNAEDLFEEER
ncbi:hypothetical protein [Streptomyces sp. I05A-00742]|uniref:hypothetical protein n=1 Tax=Streptomyces sp. I05A-00742 TaxID=2732853 RepID=UPI002898776C|nr:hypothetical protein [Streptomyces sp. I05A-00742]